MNQKQFQLIRRLTTVAYRIRNVFRRLFRTKSLGAFGLILDKDNRVMLVRLTYAPYWHFPGGGVDHRETLRTALARELQEEVGVMVQDEAEFFGIYCNKRKGWNDYPSLFIVRKFEQLLPHHCNEIAEVQWFAYKDLPDDVSEGTRARLDEFFGDAKLSEFW